MHQRRTRLSNIRASSDSLARGKSYPFRETTCMCVRFGESHGGRLTGCSESCIPVQDRTRNCDSGMRNLHEESAINAKNCMTHFNQFVKRVLHALTRRMAQPHVDRRPIDGETPQSVVFIIGSRNYSGRCIRKAKKAGARISTCHIRNCQCTLTRIRRRLSYWLGLGMSVKKRVHTGVGVCDAELTLHPIHGFPDGAERSGRGPRHKRMDLLRRQAGRSTGSAMSWSPLDNGFDSAGSVPGNPALNRPIVNVNRLAHIGDLIASAQEPERVQTHSTVTIPLLLVSAIQLVSGFFPVNR